jgi:hypothetical protein
VRVDWWPEKMNTCIHGFYYQWLFVIFVRKKKILVIIYMK